MPKNSKNPNIKYVFISGGVLSSLGKGITTSSLGMLLSAKGYKVTIVKCENYLNVDAGLINPIEHGDTFLCDDGTEADMDIGNYERFLSRDLGAHNFITMGQIYQAVIQKERNFGYEGEDVEAIPHVTDEIISRIKDAARIDKAEICLIELGGTVGEYQNVLYYEASRIMKLDHEDTVVHIHVSYLPTPSHVGEPKTKPTQLSVKQLNSMSIQPDFLVARTESEFDSRRRERLALFCNLKPGDIIINQNVDSMYQVALAFHDQNFDQLLLNKLELADNRSNLTNWNNLVKKTIGKKTGKITIAIVGKYFATGSYNMTDSYHALIEALEHTAINLETELELRYINSALIEDKGIDQLKGVDGIVVPIGSLLYGILNDKKRINVLPFSGKYIPSRNDLVIGTVIVLERPIDTHVIVKVCSGIRPYNESAKSRLITDGPYTRFANTSFDVPFRCQSFPKVYNPLRRRIR